MMHKAMIGRFSDELAPGLLKEPKFFDHIHSIEFACRLEMERGMPGMSVGRGAGVLAGLGEAVSGFEAIPKLQFIHCVRV